MSISYQIRELQRLLDSYTTTAHIKDKAHVLIVEIQTEYEKLNTLYDELYSGDEWKRGA